MVSENISLKDVMVEKLEDVVVVLEKTEDKITVTEFSEKNILDTIDSLNNRKALLVSNIDAEIQTNINLLNIVRSIDRTTKVIVPEE